MILIDDRPVDLILALAVLMIVGLAIYGIVMLLLSRRDPAAARRRAQMDSPNPQLSVVFVVPCLNEERVLAASLDRLTALDWHDLHVLVVDDGSDDATAQIVRDHADPRVQLLQRTLPEARHGKGEALNAAIRHLRSGAVVSIRQSQNVIVCVMDADGRLEPDVLKKVLPLFSSDNLGAVQVGVRINNRRDSLLARMQDIEFVLYTEVFQRGRRHLGSVGLGGNGQFVRLAALESVEGPWTRSLAEDLDLGLRLHLEAWRIEFCSATSVHQQGIVSLRAWIRQRTRWFQGHLQTWPLVPSVLDGLRGTRRADLFYHMTSPALLLIGSLLSLAFFLWMAEFLLSLVAGTLRFSPWWISAYLFAFGVTLLLGAVYWLREAPGLVGAVRTLGWLHVFVFYATLWYLAGWNAVLRTLRGHSSWSKTERNDDDLRFASENEAASAAEVRLPSGGAAR